MVLLTSLPELLNVRETPEPHIFEALRTFIEGTDERAQLPWMDAAQRSVMHVLCDGIGLEHVSEGVEPHRHFFVARPADWQMPDSVVPRPKLSRRRHTPQAAPHVEPDTCGLPASCSACGREADGQTRLMLLSSGVVCCVGCMHESAVVFDLQSDSPIDGVVTRVAPIR
jgi:hypothetical protein